MLITRNEVRINQRCAYARATTTRPRRCVVRRKRSRRALVSNVRDAFDMLQVATSRFQHERKFFVRTRNALQRRAAQTVLLRHRNRVACGNLAVAAVAQPSFRSSRQLQTLAVASSQFCNVCTALFTVAGHFSRD